MTTTNENTKPRGISGSVIDALVKRLIDREVAFSLAVTCHIVEPDMSSRDKGVIRDSAGYGVQTVYGAPTMYKHTVEACIDGSADLSRVTFSCPVSAEDEEIGETAADALEELVDKMRRSKLREFFREVVQVYRAAATRPPMEIAPTDDVHGWGTGQTKVWIEVKYDQGGVLVSVGGYEWMLKPGFGQPTPEFARDHVTRKDLRISEVGISEHIRLAREDAEPLTQTIVGLAGQDFGPGDVLWRDSDGVFHKSGTKNIPSLLKRSAAEDIDDTGHVFGGSAVIGDPNALAKQVEALKKRCSCVFGAPASMLGDGHHRARVMDELGKSIPDPFAVISNGFEECVDTNGRPCLMVDLSDDEPPVSHRLPDQGETHEEWTARKTAELEARFSATIRNTLREWPTHHGQPMTIHTQVDQGVFVLTLKGVDRE